MLIDRKKIDFRRGGFGMTGTGGTSKATTLETVDYMIGENTDTRQFIIRLIAGPITKGFQPTHPTLEAAVDYLTEFHHEKDGWRHRSYIRS